MTEVGCRWSCPQLRLDFLLGIRGSLNITNRRQCLHHATYLKAHACKTVGGGEIGSMWNLDLPNDRGEYDCKHTKRWEESSLGQWQKEKNRKEI